MNATDLGKSPVRLNLQRIYHLRYVALAGQLLAIALAIWIFKLTVPLIPLLSIVAAFVLINIVTGWRLRQFFEVSETELFVQLLLDVTALTAMLFLTGGSTNPFVMLYLVPLALTAASLPQRFTWAMAAITTACYSMLMFYYIPLMDSGHHHDQVFGLHIAGMWFGFVLSAILISWFGVRMALAVRHRDAQLARRREHELKQDKVIALGSLAAGAAHELATPLATMTILMSELDADRTLTAGNYEMIRDQLQRCKQILNSLASAAGQIRAQGGGASALDIFLEETLHSWQRMRPQAKLQHKHIQGTAPIPVIVAEQTLAQALINILNNAADASAEHVEFTAEWDEEQLNIAIADRGSGISPDLAQQAGSSIMTTKTHGLGLGLFLSFATFERLGGSVKLFNRDGGGVTCKVMLPLSMLKVNS